MQPTLLLACFFQDIPAKNPQPHFTVHTQLKYPWATRDSCDDTSSSRTRVAWRVPGHRFGT